MTVTLEANRPFLVPDTQLDRAMRGEQVTARTLRLSRADSRIRNFHVAALQPGDSVLLYNGAGGLGDQIMTWPLAKILDCMGAKVHILTDPGNVICWWNLPFVQSVQTPPIAWELAKLFDHFALFEAPVNQDSRPDQLHPLDTMLAQIGIDPESIKPEEKVVVPRFTVSELSLVNRLAGKRIALYQLAGSNPVRCLPVNDSVFLGLKLAQEVPELHWIALHDEFVPKEYAERLDAAAQKRNLTNLASFRAPVLRELWALAVQASVVVAPDSMMIHVAGSLGVPCVGLWGPCNPANRVKYYKNHFPIWKRDVCPHSPCFHYNPEFPALCPPRAAQAFKKLAETEPQIFLPYLAASLRTQTQNLEKMGHREALLSLTRELEEITRSISQFSS